MVIAEVLNQPFTKLVSNMEDFAKLFRSFFVEFVSKIGAIFTKEIFNELKKEVKALVALLLGDISSEKIKKKGMKGTIYKQWFLGKFDPFVYQIKNLFYSLHKKGWPQ